MIFKNWQQNSHGVVAIFSIHILGVEPVLRSLYRGGIRVLLQKKPCSKNDFWLDLGSIAVLSAHKNRLLNGMPSIHILFISLPFVVACLGKHRLNPMGI